MIAVVFSLVAGRLLVTDPGLVRLRIALRAALACLLTGVASIAWTVAHHQPVTLAAPGVLFAMIAPLFVRDARRPAWFATLLMLFVCASACFAAAAALSRIPSAGTVVGYAGFLLVTFVGILCQACGPRALGCALLAVVSVYLGLYLHPGAAQVVQTLLLSALGPLMVALAGRVLVPMRATANVRLAIHTVTLRAARLLATPDAARLSELNEAALALEEQLALLNLPLPAADRLRERIVEVEVAAGQHVFAASADLVNAAHADALRHAIARLETLATGSDARSGLRHDMWHDAPSLGQTVAPTRSQRLSDMRAALRNKLAWLPATRATSAALLAMLIGHALSPEHGFWAVITTFVVFLGTRSRADTVYRGAQRIAGTLAGALVSMLLAATLHHEPLILVAAMVLCVFGWAYYILSAYTPGVFFITVLVGLVYGELGFAVRPLIELRIEEVMVGCTVSFAVAILLMPLAATRHVEARLAAVLGALREVVRLAAEGADGANSGKGAHDEPVRAVSTSAAMRALDRGWHDLRIALRPLQTQRVLVWNPGIELATGSLLCCLHWARVLSRATRDDHRDHSLPGTLASNAAHVGAAHAASIVARLDALIARYSEGAVAATRNEAMQRTEHLSLVKAAPTDAGTLAQLDGAVTQLFDRLTQSARARRGMFNWAFRPKHA